MSETFDEREARVLAILREDEPTITNFDWAIPLYHFKALCAKAGRNVSGHIVTAYGPGAHGIITGVTPEGREWVAATFPRQPTASCWCPKEPPG